MDSRDRLPVRKRALCGRAAQLADPEVDFASAMTRRQQTHVVVDVDGAPFPTCEALTIGFAHLAHLAAKEFAAPPADVAPFGVRTLEKLERRTRGHFVNTVDRLLGPRP